MRAAPEWGNLELYKYTVQSESNLYNGTMQEATNSTIGAIRPCVNGTVEHEHLNTV